VHVSEQRIIVNKIVLNLAINIARRSDNFCFTLLCIEMAMYHIPSCIMSSCIMSYHQHKSYGTYVLSKEGWGKIQNDSMDKKFYK
jgi:hypothetical protein